RASAGGAVRRDDPSDPVRGAAGPGRPPHRRRAGRGAGAVPGRTGGAGRLAQLAPPAPSPRLTGGRGELRHPPVTYARVGGLGQGDGSRSGPAPGVTAPRIRGPVASVQLGTVPGSPCQVSHPSTANAYASLGSTGNPSASVVDSSAPTSARRRRSAAISPVLCTPPPE